MIWDAAIAAFGTTKELIWPASKALETTMVERESASKLIPDAPPDVMNSASIRSEYRLFMFAMGKSMDAVAYSSFRKDRVEKMDACVEMDRTVDVPLWPSSVEYWAVFAPIEEMVREPPVFMNLAVEMEMAGVYMVDRIRMVVVDISWVFRVDVCMRFRVVRPDETYKDACGPPYICAESKRTLLVDTEPVTRLEIAVVNVLALVKHCKLDETVTRPCTVILEPTRMRCVVVRELCRNIVLAVVKPPTEEKLLWILRGPAVDTPKSTEAPWTTYILDWTI